MPQQQKTTTETDKPAQDTSDWYSKTKIPTQSPDGKTKY